jgi:hypothetical protein
MKILKPSSSAFVVYIVTPSGYSEKKRKIKRDLSAPEIDFEILMYIIMGINDCFICNGYTGS